MNPEDQALPRGLIYETGENPAYPGQWHVEAIGPDGEVYIATFSGPLAERRAREYERWKNSAPHSANGRAAPPADER